MKSSSVYADTKASGYTLAAFRLAGAQLLPEAFDTCCVFIAELHGLNIMKGNEPSGTHKGCVKVEITRYALVGVMTVNE
jgi:hypothetical protein